MESSGDDVSLRWPSLCATGCCLGTIKEATHNIIKLCFVENGERGNFLFIRSHSLSISVYLMQS